LPDWAWPLPVRARVALTDAFPAVLLLVLTVVFGLDPRLLDPDVVNGKLPGGQVGVEAVSHLAVATWWTATAVMLAGLVLRRRLPLAVLAVATAGQIAHLSLTGFPDAPVDAAPAVALYTVAAHPRRRAVSIGAGLAAALGSTVATATPSRVFQLSTPFLRQWPVLLLVAAWLIGDNVRSRRAYLHQVEARARDLEREQQRQAESAAAAERARISRELHDVVAHGLSVIVIQAQAAAQAMQEQPAVARTALDSIVDSGRQALTEMRRLLELDADRLPDGQRAPLPGLGDLPDLVERVRAAGLPVTFALDGSTASVPALIGLSAYRIVQEGLTNTLKHAGPGAAASVCVRCEPAGVQIRVEDDGTGPLTQPDTGHGRGLRGMRERVTTFGGELSAGPGPDGGFHLHARLPLNQ
jgi:signal transduction histidine kinase